MKRAKQAAVYARYCYKPRGFVSFFPSLLGHAANLCHLPPDELSPSYPLPLFFLPSGSNGTNLTPSWIIHQRIKPFNSPALCISLDTQNRVSTSYFVPSLSRGWEGHPVSHHLPEGGQREIENLQQSAPLFVPVIHCVKARACSIFHSK